MSVQLSRFLQFYKEVFLAEHQHPANVALHVLGTVAGLVFLMAAPLLSTPWLLLVFPVVHAAPGLIGHRLFERSLLVGDIRVMRKDHSPLLFIVANHLMTWELLRRGFYWRAPSAQRQSGSEDS